MYNINDALNRNGQSTALCDRFLHFPHKTTLCCLIKDYHIRTINIMVQAATFFMLGIAMVVVVFVAFYVVPMLDGSIFGVTHTPAAPKFELFLRTSSIRSSKKFEEKVQTFCSKNFELFRIVRKRKMFWNLFDFCEIFRFFKKNRTFPEVPADYSIEQQKMNHACHTFCDISKMAVSFSLV
jgi:hypothetical protein